MQILQLARENIKLSNKITAIKAKNYEKGVLTEKMIYISESSISGSQISKNTKPGRTQVYIQSQG